MYWIYFKLDSTIVWIFNYLSIQEVQQYFDANITENKADKIKDNPAVVHSK